MAAVSNSTGYVDESNNPLNFSVENVETLHSASGVPLPQELHVEMLSYLSMPDLLQMTLVNKSFYILGNDKVLWQELAHKFFSKHPVGVYPAEASLIRDGETGKKFCKRITMEVARVKNEVEQNMPASIIETFFGGIENFRQITVPLLYNEFPARDYIDFLREKNFPEGKSILVGVDPYNRPFVSCKIQVTAQVSDDERKLSEYFERETFSVFTIFQRHTEGNKWCSGTNEMRSIFYTLPSTFYCEKIGQGEDADQHENLISLLRGEALTTKNGHHNLSLE